MASSLFGSRGARRPHLVKVGQSGLAGEVSDLRADVEAAFQAFDDSPSFGQYLNTVRTVTPTGPSDDAANIQAAIDAMAGVGEVRLKPGTYSIASPLTMRSNLIITGHPLTVLNSTQTPSGTTADTASVFLSNLYSSLAGTTTLSADLALGATTLTVASATGLAIGDWIAVRDQNGYRVVLFQIANLSGTTVTMDRPMTWTEKFASGATVVKFASTPLHNLIINGNGMTVSGTGDRIVSLVASHDCLVEGIRGRGTFQNYACSFDLGGHRNRFRNMDIDGGATSVACLALESQEGSSIETSRAVNAKTSTGNGIILTSGTQLTIRDCEGSSNPGNGMLIATNADAAETSGCRLVRVFGGRWNKNGGSGIRVTYGSSMGTIVGATAEHNGTAGFEIYNVIAAPVRDWTLVGCTAFSNVYGFYVSGAATVSLESPTTRYNTSAGLYIDAGIVSQSGGTHREVAGPCVNVPGTNGVYIATGAQYFNEAAGIMDCVQAWGAGSQVHLTRCRGDWLNAVNGAVLGLNGTGTGFIDGCTKTGAFTNASIVFVNDATDCCFVTGSSQHITAAGSGKLSRGTVVANGTTPVAVGFTAIKATHVVALVRTTTGGTPGTLPLVTITAGTGFSITSVAGDTSTYSFSIV